VGVNELDRFASELAGDDGVRVVGGRTQWDVGGPPSADAREVRAPAGIVEHNPAEMTVRVMAGTTVSELDAALAERGQTVALPAWPGATVGGVIAVGRSGIRRLGYGPVRDAVLELRVVTSDGRAVTAGGPTVKNVSGFDLVRLFTGSIGTLVSLGQAVLRTRPVPERSWWIRTDADPFVLLASLHRPMSLLWDGAATWVLLEGPAAAVDDQRHQLEALGTAERVDGPPALPAGRWSCRPSDLRHAPDRHRHFVAEVGVGVLHVDEPPPRREPDPHVVALHDRLKARFDPTARLNPGRTPLGVG
jgi:glycolate oxidase FAD binding subunit